jgi:soluble lytic murein transglycosylase-like protein
MQLMPGTARDLGVDATQAGDNALGGAKYLRALLLRYHCNSALALAAYNAGPGAVQRFGGVPPYAETRNYVRRVTREYDRELQQATRAKAASLGAGQ